MDARQQFTLARRYLRTEPSIFSSVPDVPADVWAAARETMFKAQDRRDWTLGIRSNRYIIEWVKFGPSLSYGCRCKSCLQTNRYTRAGFEKWPRGEITGKRASDAAYSAHVSHLWEGVKRDLLRISPTPRFPVTGTPHIAPRLEIPQRTDEGDIKAYIRDFERLNNLIPQKKPRPAETGAARPDRPCKARQHFPARDRPRRTGVIYAMRKAKSLSKRPRGRPALPGRRVVVKLLPEHIERAKSLSKDGKGISEGIRKALS